MDRLPPLPTAEEQPTLTVPDAGQYLGLSRWAAYQAARNGELPIIRVGHRILVSTAEFRRLLRMDSAS